MSKEWTLSTIIRPFELSETILRNSAVEYSAVLRFATRPHRVLFERFSDSRKSKTFTTLNPQTL